MLNSMQKDVLTEMINVYIGKAASLLSEMVNQRILLTVPEIDLISVSSADQFSNRFSPIFTPGHIISSSMRFGESFDGKAYLVFPAEQAKLLVNACLGEDLDGQDPEDISGFIDTDFDVLKEISNVILNAIIGEFSNFLGTKLEYSLPEIEVIYVSESEQKPLLKDSTYILILYTSFLLAETKVKGVIMIALSMNSVTWLIENINALLEA